MMKKPYIILHMVTTADGKVTGDFLRHPSVIKLCEEYYRIHREYHADAYLCGRVTFEGSFTFGRTPQTEPFIGQPVDDGDYIFSRFDRYAIAIDTHGRLGWDDNMIHDEDPGYDNAHIVEVVTEATPKAYLAYLRNLHISYIICGEIEIDAPLLCEKLYSLLGVRTLLLEGGGITDSLFLQDDMIDELSLVTVPYVDGTEGTSIFSEKHGGSLRYRHVLAEALPDGALWLRYTEKEFVSTEV